MAEDYALTRDPIYYITVGFFSILTTALPAAIGQPRFLPIVQALALSIFVLIPLRRRDVRAAAWVLAIWLCLQFVSMALLSSWTLVNIERAIPNGFSTRGEILSWFFGASSYPYGLASQPLQRFGELLGVLIGSALTAGFVGAWFLMRATNLAAFETGVLISSVDGGASYLLATLPWNLLRLAGYACLLLLFTQLLLADVSTFVATMRKQHRLVIAAAVLLVLAMLSEWTLTVLWQRLATSIA